MFRTMLTSDIPAMSGSVIGHTPRRAENASAQYLSSPTTQSRKNIMSKKPKKRSTPDKVNKKSEPDHESVAMIRYGITREMNYIYFCGGYKYDSLNLAISQAIRNQHKKT